MTCILAIDQGTTSSRAILFEAGQPGGGQVEGILRPIASAQEEFPQIFPAPGLVEHDPADLWASVAATSRAAIEKAGIGAGDIAAIGITNQRETTLLWDRATGQPLHNAIVWQDRRTASQCEALREAGHEPMISARTGLLLDPYFSATKLAYLLDTIPGARARAKRGELAFGTVDSWLIWNLTGGRIHATDATNAARTMLFNIRENRWDPDLCALFDIPAQLLPEVRDCAADYGRTRADLFGREIPILGVAGDQQAAAMGQACFHPGMLKATYGTGCFALLNTGETFIPSQNRLLTTVASRLNGRIHYALEGSVFIAGAVVQWLRVGLRIIREAGEAEVLAARADPGQDVILVPAFTGIGAPYWHPESRGAIFGLTRNTGPAELTRAALESIGYQTRDLIGAMQADWGAEKTGILRADGGVTVSDRVMQFLADMIGQRVDRPVVTETTALGAAFLAGMQAGISGGPEDFARSWALDRSFLPQMPGMLRDEKYTRWQRAVAATMQF
ncbi:glycerol kinase GlpK [Pseudogemmobacter bohemicus]|uniref:glycerol kinase GlpK n=1 Tax=Pseudogemmobacter bohemicus TaxID=2250708 RepID=UPI000DD4DA31|nr:glycerol kinase GlpK [Pseudogemmobacter bohemicus]